MTDEWGNVLIIYSSVFLALVWALINMFLVLRIKMTSLDQNYYDDNPLNSEKNNLIDGDKVTIIQNIGDKISKGANAFLF